MGPLLLFSPNELCVSVVSLKSPQVGSHSKFPAIIFSFLKDIGQHLNPQSSEFTNILKTLKKVLDDTKNIAAAFSEINFEIKYSFELIQTLAVVNYSNSNDTNINNYSLGYALLLISLQVYADIQNSRNPTNSLDNEICLLLPNLFQCLIKYSEITSLSNIKNLLLSSFHNLYQIYIETIGKVRNPEIQNPEFEQIRIYVYEFFSQNPDLPKNAYFILCGTVKKLLNKNVTMITQPETEFFTFIDMCAREREKIFPSEVIECCIECMTVRLNHLDLFSITFFSHFTDRVSSKFSLTYFEAFPFAVYHYIMNDTPLINVYKDFCDIPSVESISMKSTSEFLFGFNKTSSLIKEKIDFETSIIFPEFQSMSNFIRSDVNSRIQLLAKAAEPKPKLIRMFVSTFCRVISQMTDSPLIFDFIAIFLVVIGNYLPVFDVQEVFLVLNKSPLFDSKVNVFSSETDIYSYIFPLRTISFDFFYKMNLLSNFVDLNINRPLILAEHLQRIIQSDILINEEQKVKLVRSILTAELGYQRLNIINKGVKIARASIFVLLSRLLTDSKFAVDFFKEDWFDAIFILSFLFEDSLQSFVLRCIRNSLLVVDENKGTKVQANILTAIKIATDAFPSSHSLSIVNDTIAMLNEVINNRPSIIDTFGIIREPIAKALAVLAAKINDDARGMAKEIFVQSIIFFTATSVCCKTTAAMVSSFESAATSFHGENLPPQMFGRIVQLISGSVTPSLQPNFIIREPKFTRLFLKLFFLKSQNMNTEITINDNFNNNIINENSNDLFFIDVLLFLIKLCDFARENCIACHKGKVDSYLVEILVSLKGTYHINKEEITRNSNEEIIVEHIITLLTSIVVVVSSASFVHQCFALFTPIKDKISLLQPNLIKMMSNIINKTGHNPSASFPLLSKGSKYILNFEDSTSFSEGFTFLSWIYFDSPTSQYLPSVFEITDSADQRISLHLNLARLIVQNKTKRSKSVGICDKILPSHNWTFIAVNFYLKHENGSKGQDRAVVYFNNKPTQDISFPHFEMSHGQVKMTIGGTKNENNIDSELPVLMASFGVFPLLDEASLNMIRELGPKMKETPFPSYAMIQTMNLNNELKFNILKFNNGNNNISGSSKKNNSIKDDTNNFNFPLNEDPQIAINVNKVKIDFIRSEKKVKQTPNFTDVLLSSVKIDNLLPLFAQLDLNYTDGTPYIQCEELSLEVLGSALTSSINAQIFFYDSNGVDIICHFLHICDPVHITYKLYMRFFSLYQNVSFSPLQTKIFNSLLYNFDLLTKASSENHLLILKHWSRSLFPAALSSKTAGEISFKYLMNALVFYYWEVIPQHVFLPRDPNSNLDISKCRKCITDLLFLIAQHYFNDEDLTSFVSHIINCKDVKQIENFLCLLRSLAKIEKSPLKNTQKKSRKNLSLLLYLLNFKEEIIISNTIDVLILLIKNKIITDLSLPELVEVVIQQLTIDDASEVLLQNVIALMMNGSYDLFSIALFIAVTLGEERLLSFINSTKPSSLYYTHFSWSFWPILIMYKTTDIDVQKKLIKFLIQCGIQGDNAICINIMVMLDYVGNLLQIDSSDYKSRSLSLLCESLFNLSLSSINKNDIKFLFEKINCCIDLVARFLFYRTSKEENEGLEEMMRASPFAIQKTRRRMKMSSSLNGLFNNTSTSNKGSPLSLGSVVQPMTSYLQTGGKMKGSLLLMNSPNFGNFLNNSERVIIKPAEIFEILHHHHAKNKASGCSFGLRFDGYGNWCDLDIAEACIKIFIKQLSMYFEYSELFVNEKVSDIVKADTILIMSSFLIRQDPEMTEPFVSALVQMIQSIGSNSISPNNENAFPSSLVYSVKYSSYLNYSAKQVNLPPFFPELDNPIELASTALESIRQTRFGDVLLIEVQLPNLLGSFFGSNWTKSLGIFSLIDDSIVTMTSNLTQNFFDSHKLKEKENSKMWDRLWRSLSFDRAPWNINKENDNDQINTNLIQLKQFHWRRDFSACEHTTQMKIKRNWYFDDHKDAALMRDNKEKGEIDEIISSKKNVEKEQMKEEKKEKDVESNKKLSLKNIYQCELIQIKRTLIGDFMIYSDFIKFSCKTKTKLKLIKFEDIRYLYLRNRIHLPTAIEIFTVRGKSYFFNFFEVNGLDILKKLSRFNMPRVRRIQSHDMKTYFRMNSLTDKWVNREISNFDYLMHLNIMSGRTFNDLSQYPVFPWVITDFESDYLDLTNRSVYRDLSKPCGALNPSKMKLIKERAEQMMEAEAEGNDSNGNISKNNNFLYTSGFAYPNLVIDFLIRIEPFTSLHIDLQHGKFDSPQRIFYSIPRTWQHVISVLNDNRELIPEFYSTPEFLLNLENFDFGIEPDLNTQINDVVLPPWCTSPYDFIYKMRKALESEYVSSHLNEWIDLIWGVNQKKEDNLYRPEMYEDIWESTDLGNSNQDSNSREALDASLLNVGQVPPQLFNIPHPTRTRPLSMYCNHQVFTFPTDAKNVLAAFCSYSKKEWKSFVTIVTSEYKICKFTIAQRSMKKMKNQRQSLSDAKSRFAQMFEVSSSIKEIKKKGIIPSTTNEKLIFSFLKPSTLVVSVYGSSEISLINTLNANSGYTINTPLSETSAIDAQRDFFVVACRNAVVNVYKYGSSLSNNNIINFNNINNNNNINIINNNDINNNNNSNNNGINNNNNINNNINNNDYEQNNLTNNNNNSKSNVTKQIASIPSYRSKLTCVALSERFNMIVNGTQDGFLVISSLTSFAVENIIDLDKGRPYYISISPSFGFIIVYYTIINSGIVDRFVSVYNVNGHFLSKQKIEFTLTSLYTFTAPTGFDFVLIADTLGKLYLSDIYEPCIGESFFRCHAKLVTVSYDRKNECFIAVSSDGSIMLISHDFL